VSSHDPREPCPGLEQFTGTVRLNHPFGQTTREVRLAILTGRHKANQGDFVGSQTRATRLMMLDGPPRVARQPLDQAGKSRQGLLAVLGSELPREFVPDKGPMFAIVLTEPEDPSAEGPNDKPFRWVKLGC